MVHGVLQSQDRARQFGKCIFPDIATAIKYLKKSKMPLTDAQITRKVGQLRRTEGQIYAPLKYFRGLETLKEVETRYKKMLKRDYTKFQNRRRKKDEDFLLHPKV